MKHMFLILNDLYGSIIDIVILEKIRENKSIRSLEELKLMIDDDITHIKKDVFYGMTFGTFDKFHPWHMYYLSQSRKYCEQLITILSTDKNVQKIKNHAVTDSQNTRKLHVQSSGISDIVYIWDEHDHLKYIKIYSPKVICLWYDQEGFIGELEAYIKESWMQTELIRIGDYKSNIYKSSKM